MPPKKGRPPKPKPLTQKAEKEMMGQEDMKKYWLPWLVGMPAETSRAICSMLFGGIFDKFLKVMFAHGGGSFRIRIDLTGRLSCLTFNKTFLFKKRIPLVFIIFEVKRIPL